MIRINTFGGETVSVVDGPEGRKTVQISARRGELVGEVFHVPVVMSASEAEAIGQALMPHPEEKE